MARPSTTDAGRAKYQVERVGSLVKAARKRRGLGTIVASRQIGIGRQTLIRIEAGQEDTKASVLVKVFAWLDGKS